MLYCLYIKLVACLRFADEYRLNTLRRLLSVFVRVLVVALNKFAGLGVSHLVPAHHKAISSRGCFLVLEIAHFFGAFGFGLLALLAAHGDGAGAEFEVDGTQVIVLQSIHDVLNFDQ